MCKSGIHTYRKHANLSYIINIQIPSTSKCSSSFRFTYLLNTLKETVLLQYNIYSIDKYKQNVIVTLIDVKTLKKKVDTISHPET